MSTGYPIPQEIFNSQEHARNKVLRANQTQISIVKTWQDSYEDFYGIDSTGSRYTSQQMQEIIDAISHPVFFQIANNSRAFVLFVDQIDPNFLEDKYKTPAFELTYTDTTVTVGELKPEWIPPIEEQ